MKQYEGCYSYDKTIIKNNISLNDIKYSIIILNTVPNSLYFTLQTIANSKYEKYEIIIVSSHDKLISKKILDYFSIPIIFIQIKNKSWLNNDLEFNIGIKYANGKYVIMQSSAISHINDIVYDIDVFYETNKDYENSSIIYPIIKLIKSKDNHNILYKFYNKENNIIIRNHILHKKIKYEKYHIFDMDRDNNFLIIIPKKHFVQIMGFDYDLAVYTKSSIKNLIQKLKCIVNTNIHYIELNEYIIKNKPLCIKQYSEDNLKDKDYLLTKIKYNIMKAQFLYIKPNNDVSNMKNILRMIYHKNASYGNNIYDFFYNKKLKHKFKSINYSKGEFKYILKDSIDNMGIYFTIYPHIVNNLTYEIFFKAKGTCTKELVFYDTNCTANLGTLNSEYKCYHIIFKWNNINLEHGQPHNKYYISIKNAKEDNELYLTDIILKLYKT